MVKDFMLQQETMKFELKPYNVNVTEKELIDDLVYVAKQLGKKTLTQKEYTQSKLNRFSGGTIAARLGGWNNAIERASLVITKYASLSDEELIEDLKRVAKEISPKKITQKLYSEIGNYTPQTINERFGWNDALEKIGLEISVKQNITDEELFKNLEDVWIKLGHQPGKRDMVKYNSKYSQSPYRNKFGTWRKALEAFVEYINTEEHIQKNEDQEVLKETKEIQSAKHSFIHKTKRDINLRIRFLVMRRDNFKCVMCGKSPATHLGITLEVDHILAWTKGGETVLENLQTSCSDCNKGKSNLNFTESE